MLLILVERCPQNRLLLSHAWLNYVIGVECSNWTTDSPLKIFLAPSHSSLTRSVGSIDCCRPAEIIYFYYYFLKKRREREEKKRKELSDFDRPIWIIKLSWSMWKKATIREQNKSGWISKKEFQVGRFFYIFYINLLRPN